jgi:two-component system nitrate/nitrite response regulator NarL
VLLENRFLISLFLRGSSDIQGMVCTHNHRIRIEIIDNQVLVRAGLRLLIEGQTEMEVIGEAGNIDEGLDLAARLKPEIILLEINLSADPCFEVIPKLIGTSDQARVILVTSAYSSQVFLQAVQSGVMGVVTKTQKPEVLIKAIEKVHAGEVWIERSLMANLLTRLSHNHRSNGNNPEAERINKLSDRERQIIQLIGHGLKNKQIAAQLCISETTVRHHLTSVFSKLEVSDRLELLVYAHRSGLAKIPE